MSSQRLMFTLLFSSLLAGGAEAAEGGTLLQNGSYEVEMRLEIPNVHNWTFRQKTTICISNAGLNTLAPLPILSGNNPVANCPASDVQRDGAILTFEILCEGRNASRARAVFRLAERSFDGRIAFVMGAKNMTFTEVQSGRRVGSCDLAGAQQN